MTFQWKYSVTFKRVSSQPDIPWGVIKHRLDLINEYDTNLMYVDGYDLTWGGNGDSEQRRNTAFNWAKKAKFETPHEQYGARLKAEARPELSNLTSKQLRDALEALTDEWERNWVRPYILGFLDAEDDRYATSAALAAAYEEDEG